MEGSSRTAISSITRGAGVLVTPRTSLPRARTRSRYSVLGRTLGAPGGGRYSPRRPALAYLYSASPCMTVTSASFTAVASPVDTASAERVRVTKISGSIRSTYRTASTTMVSRSSGPKSVAGSRSPEQPGWAARPARRATDRTGVMQRSNLAGILMVRSCSSARWWARWAASSRLPR